MIQIHHASVDCINSLKSMVLPPGSGGVARRETAVGGGSLSDATRKMLEPVILGGKESLSAATSSRSTPEVNARALEVRYPRLVPWMTGDGLYKKGYLVVDSHFMNSLSAQSATLD